eukprot:224355-Hanusia_phi.AAC.1
MPPAQSGVQHRGTDRAIRVRVMGRNDSGCGSPWQVDGQDARNTRTQWEDTFIKPDIGGAVHPPRRKMKTDSEMALSTEGFR